ncbi:transglycosylase SLT domain-containing protein [Beggiatoa leptomitoformis]|uniref:Transglycosylase SLT domain-containing protein n=1 Tax=Beggiatoa leptomitoformis TaxID=288004 RepID=A0A2N9YCM4_9GAMM|nr:transglycosylase SLT domain-containing protein [Beggiatoa leptomitoformis]AUI68212.1 transglycosylase SLT domain-containing protein [Beggiatoa leptomitoformis]QGX03436.1 transglycosylase SLT domain-containing protein [Beggiatoa leptomitoformis]
MKTCKVTLIIIYLLSTWGCSTLDTQNDSLFAGDANLYSTLQNRVVSALELHKTLPAFQLDQYLKKPVETVAEIDDDLWNRVRAGYRLGTMDNVAIREALTKYQKSPRYFNQFTSNAEPYLYYIVEELEYRGMPLELALLPAIESSFEPTLVSSERASGIWQFIPSTAKNIGLRLDNWYDGRRDIIESTQAALDYLQELHDQFDDDWLLALAAYNYGQGNIKKAIQRNRQAGKLTDYWSLDLPAETRAFVPRLLAIARIVATPEKYGVKLYAIPNKTYFEQIDVGQQIDISTAAQLVGLSTSTLKRLNPAYSNAVTAPDGPHYLTLPVGKASVFKENLSQLAENQSLVTHEFTASALTLNPQLLDKPVQIHQVKRGESLGKIAQRYDTTADTLRQLNQLSSKPRLRAGQKLRVPIEKAVTPLETLIAKSTTHATTAKGKATSNLRQRITYTVKAGDSPTTIARRYSVSVADINQWNKLKKGKLKQGQKLVIWQDG